MRRFLPLGATTALAVATAILTVPGSTQALVADRAAATKVKTEFAMKATGYGTRVQGGSVPVQSGTTAYQTIGCTNKAGLARRNDVAAVTLPGLGQVDGIRTRVNTYTNEKKGRTSVVSQHDVAKVTLGGQLTLTAVSSKATVWHDKDGFHKKVETSIGGIRAGGDTFPIPTPNVPIAIPGLATIYLGDQNGYANKEGAYAAGNAIKVVLEPSDTVIRIAHSAAKINRGVKVGRFRGQAHGTQVDALDENVRSGPNPLSYMPCQGTAGKVREKSVAGVDLAGEIVVGAVRNRQMGEQNNKRATGFEESTIAGIKLGPLQINAIKARANVTRFRDGRIKRNANGTTIGEIVVDGESQAIPPPGQALEIPGLLRLEANVVEKTRLGIKVTAVRLTLLDGTGATVNLGNARLEIKPSGVKK
ncbi:choice-of-anchor P family protein [Nocardioides sp. SOB77]|uniref:Choice-of-anchor P family protein n=1 Tax=Nocardioides oceani TaxID=3058369 RepID=A0ABT8FFU9_9ACTN|nr:choice-of-anchor P family protein [Nocardioides oceani]MDN4173410.1 choice-of-anchor P family protein [Nocardioides oceani]